VNPPAEELAGDIQGLGKKEDFSTGGKI